MAQKYKITGNRTNRNNIILDKDIYSNSPESLAFLELPVVIVWMAVLRGRRGHCHGGRCHDEEPQHAYASFCVKLALSRRVVDVD